MAIHKLDDESYLNLKFNSDLWKGIDTKNLSELVSDIYPPIRKVTSLSENRNLVWFYGRVGIEGEGYVEVTYPIQGLFYSDFTLPNVDFSTFPFIHIRAIPLEKSEFRYWKDSVTGEILEEKTDLMLTEYTFLESTGFVAVFEDASDLGI